MSDNDRICENQPYGEHITVRCSGCNSIHSTKNIGSCNPETHTAGLWRSLFDILGTHCICEDAGQFPLIHNCEIDDNLDIAKVSLEHLGDPVKHVARTPEARLILQSWWKLFAKSKSRPEPTSEELDALVVLVE